MSVTSFYNTGIGEELINADNYSPAILEYLKSETDIIESMSKSCTGVIEVGCMHGRHLKWAIDNNKHYIGIDIIDRYIQEAKKNAEILYAPSNNYQFFTWDARHIDKLFEDNNLRDTNLNKNNFLIFFPFNSFGNIENIDEVLISLFKSGMIFIINTYKTDDITTQHRYKYYENSANTGIQIIKSNEGVRITSDEGLNSMAYSYNFLRKKCLDIGINLHYNFFGLSGMCFYNEILK